MKLTIEFEQTKITLSVGSEGVIIDAPDTVDEETRQTTLSEAQWAAYAQGREDEREEHECDMCGYKKNEDLGPIEPLSEFPRFDELVETESLDRAEPNPPKVDPVTGNIAGWVKAYRSERRKRALEVQPRAVCISTCCGTEGARTRDGSCRGCR